jgi:hypothetical protein
MQEEMMILMKASLEKMETKQKKVETKTEACPVRMEANQEKLEATGMEALTVNQEVPKEEAAVETIGAPEDRSGDKRPAVGYRNARKRWTKDDLVSGTPKARTFDKRRCVQPKCNYGIWDRGMKQQLRLGSNGNINEALRQIIELEIIKRIIGSSFRIRKAIRHCGGPGHRPSERRDCTQLKSLRCKRTDHSLKFRPQRPGQKMAVACRLFDVQP